MKKIIALLVAVFALFSLCACSHTHTIDEWSVDYIGHWHICTECGEKLNYTAHVNQTGYYNSNKEVYIQKNGEKLTIPYSEISNGATVENDAYPYIYSTASAWDCLDSGFDKNAECAGVSLKGVDYLCRHGFSAEQALLHYLPGFEIKA